MGSTFSSTGKTLKRKLSMKGSGSRKASTKNEDTWEHGDVYRECDSEGLPESLRSPADVMDFAAASEHCPGFACSGVQGMRNSMEDQHVAARPLLQCKDGEHICMFGVFDGHGGAGCSAYLKSNLANAVREHLEQDDSNVEDALRRAFAHIDTKYCESEGEVSESEGSTAVVVVIRGNKVFCANTGDSRAVLCSAGADPAALSHDHKPSRPDERQRIEKLGGCVLYNRVMGRLGVSRAFGDKSLKEYVTAEPEIISMELTEGHDFVILACDGLWDVADMDTASGLVRSHLREKGLEGAAQALTTYAVRNGSNDNVTAMVVSLAQGPYKMPK